MPETMDCPFCKASIDPDARKCRFCGEWVARGCVSCGTPLRGEWAARGVCAECRKKPAEAPVQDLTTQLLERKNRGVASILALTVGGLGVHKFYLGKPVKGIFYLLFAWTLIPALIALFEGVSFAIMDDEDFQRKFGRWGPFRG